MKFLLKKLRKHKQLSENKMLTKQTIHWMSSKESNDMSAACTNAIEMFFWTLW